MPRVTAARQAKVRVQATRSAARVRRHLAWADPPGRPTVARTAPPPPADPRRCPPAAHLGRRGGGRGWPAVGLAEWSHRSAGPILVVERPRSRPGHPADTIVKGHEQIAAAGLPTPRRLRGHLRTARQRGAIWSQSGRSTAHSDPVTGPLSCRDGGAPRGIRTPNRQIRSLVVCVGLVGSRPIWAAHVGCLVDPDGPDGSRRIVWMIKRMIKWRGAESSATQATATTGGAGTRYSIW